MRNNSLSDSNNNSSYTHETGSLEDSQSTEDDSRQSIHRRSQTKKIFLRDVDGSIDDRYRSFSDIFMNSRAELADFKTDDNQVQNTTVNAVNS